MSVPAEQLVQTQRQARPAGLVSCAQQTTALQEAVKAADKSTKLCSFIMANSLPGGACKLVIVMALSLEAAFLVWLLAEKQPGSTSPSLGLCTASGFPIWASPSDLQEAASGQAQTFLCQNPVLSKGPRARDQGRFNVARKKVSGLFRRCWMLLEPDTVTRPQSERGQTHHQEIHVDEQVVPRKSRLVPANWRRSEVSGEPIVHPVELTLVLECLWRRHACNSSSQGLFFWPLRFDATCRPSLVLVCFDDVLAKQKRRCKKQREAHLPMKDQRPERVLHPRQAPP